MRSVQVESKVQNDVLNEPSSADGSGRWMGIHNHNTHLAVVVDDVVVVRMCLVEVVVVRMCLVEVECYPFSASASQPYGQFSGGCWRSTAPPGPHFLPCPPSIPAS